MPKTVLIPLAHGFEEIEAVTPMDVLRRAGAEVTVAGLGGVGVQGSRGVRILADLTIEDCRKRQFDLILLPGGMPGAANLAENPVLKAMLLAQRERGGLIAAICAAPALVLAPLGLLEGRRATCYPSFADRMGQAGRDEAPVVRDGDLITAAGPGSAMGLALALVQALYGPDKEAEVRRAMLA
jgi:4-methyl-5(b-hydroxyethyl)-thiazole monophosphate biosynthesis